MELIQSPGSAPRRRFAPALVVLFGSPHLGLLAGESECCQAPVNVIVQEEPSGQTAELFANDVRADCADDSEAANTVVAGVPHGSRGRKTLFFAIVSQLDGFGVQGWSLAAVVRGGPVPVEATTRGTVAGDAASGPPGIRQQGFESTYLLSPDLRDPVTGERQGPAFVSAVVLSFRLPVTLDPVGTATVLAVTIETTSPLADGESAGGEVFWQPVEDFGPPAGEGGGATSVTFSSATANGESYRFCECRTVHLRFHGVPLRPFLRCDPNADGTADIGDVVWVLNDLFRGGTPTRCPGAADCNGDARVDVADAVYGLEYQFHGGSPPPPPFPECGLVELEIEACPPGATSCPR
jgi:hypothetical protein